MRNPKAEEKLRQLRLLDKPYSVLRCGLEITVLPQVYPTSELSEMVADCLKTQCEGREAERALDYGTGTGFLALMAARYAQKAVAVDINPAALECAQLNARKHGVTDKMETRLSDGMAAIKPEEKFDIILAGMPWDDAPAASMIDYAMYDPNYAMRDSLLQHAQKHLTPCGFILLTYCERLWWEQPLHTLAPMFDFRILACRRSGTNVDYVVRAVTK